MNDLPNLIKLVIHGSRGISGGNQGVYAKKGSVPIQLPLLICEKK
jgi:hypothetical protein